MVSQNRAETDTGLAYSRSMNFFCCLEVCTGKGYKLNTAFDHRLLGNFQRETGTDVAVGFRWWIKKPGTNNSASSYSDRIEALHVCGECGMGKLLLGVGVALFGKNRHLFRHRRVPLLPLVGGWQKCLHSWSDEHGKVKFPIGCKSSALSGLSRAFSSLLCQPHGRVRYAPPR